MAREGGPGGGGGGSPGAASPSSSSPASSGSPAAFGSASDASSPSGAGRGGPQPPAAAAAAELEDGDGGGGDDDELDGVDFGPYEPGPGFRGEAPGGRAAEAGDELWLVHLPQGLEAAALHGATLRLAGGAGDLVATVATKGGRELAVMAESPAYVRGLAGLVAGEGGGGWAAKDLTRAVAVMQRPPEAPERTEGGGVEQIEIVDRAVLALEEAQKKRKAKKGGTSREHREAAKGEAGAEAGGAPPPKKAKKKTKDRKRKA